VNSFTVAHILETAGFWMEATGPCLSIMRCDCLGDVK